VLTPLHDDRRYICPGEPGEISRSVHLARVAASYARCRTCPHSQESGALKPTISVDVDNASSFPGDTGNLLRTSQGFRGISINQLGRYEAIHWAAGLACLLWDEVVSCPLGTDNRRFPTIVIGYDGRPSAPEVMTGFALGFERSSCRVIDIGLTTEPCLRFAVRQFDADAGVMITGSGCDPAWIGFDVCRKYGLPPEAEFLDRWETIQRQPLSRPSRSPGSVSAVSPVEAYEAGLSNWFHALRPLHVVCGAASAAVLSRLEGVFSRLSGRLQPVLLPTRRRNLADPQDADALRIGAAVRDRTAHLGIVMDDDASACAFVDERGGWVDAIALNTKLIEMQVAEQVGGNVLLAAEVWDDLATPVTSCGGQPVLVESGDRAARLMIEPGLLAIAGDHRLWVGAEYPVCDAIITLALVMQLLSRSDAEFSRVLHVAAVEG
jgi:phosphomannomutase